MNTIVIGAIINGIVLLAIAIINKVSEFKLENLKVENSQQQQYKNNKRDIYGKLASSLSVFIENRHDINIKKKIQDDFFEVYDQIWIWGNQEINKKLGDFLQATIEGKDDATLKKLHVEIILEMRKDLDMPNNNLSIDDYKFISFNN
jgi:hypothetical protein